MQKDNPNAKSYTCTVCKAEFQAVKTRCEPKYCSNRCKMVAKNLRNKMELARLRKLAAKGDPTQ